MKTMKLLYVTIAILAAWQMRSATQIRNLETELQQTKNSVAYAEDRLNGNISLIYSNVDEKLTEQASIVSSATYEIGELNPETRKAPITFRLQLKTLTETTEASLKFGEEMLAMKRENTAFVLTKEFAITDEVLPTIVVEDTGIQQFENNGSLHIYDVKNELFPSLYPQFQGESWYNHEEPYRYNLKGEIETNLNSDTQNHFDKIQYIITIDDKVKKTYTSDTSNGGTIPIDETFEMKEGQTLIGTLVATDKLNYKQEYMITQYVAGEKEPLGYYGYYENAKIIAPDGTVIYEYKENEF